MANEVGTVALVVTRVVPVTAALATLQGLAAVQGGGRVLVLA